MFISTSYIGSFAVKDVDAATMWLQDYLFMIVDKSGVETLIYPPGGGSPFRLREDTPDLDQHICLVLTKENAKKLSKSLKEVGAIVYSTTSEEDDELFETLTSPHGFGIRIVGCDLKD